MPTSPDRAGPSLGSADRGRLRRSVDLFRAFRVEQTDPDHFYRIQAADTVDQLRRWAPVDGQLIVDVGGGAGYFTEALVAAGARCILVEPEAGAPAVADRSPNGSGAAPTTIADAERTRRERHRL